jgi:hypothetical protein
MHVHEGFAVIAVTQPEGCDLTKEFSPAPPRAVIWVCDHSEISAEGIAQGARRAFGADYMLNFDGVVREDLNR